MEVRRVFDLLAHYKEKYPEVKFFKINGPKSLNASVDFVIITFPNIFFHFIFEPVR